jgi:hypothetical protein
MGLIYDSLGFLHHGLAHRVALGLAGGIIQVAFALLGFQAASVDDWTWGWVAGFGTEWAFGGPVVARY